MSSLLSKRGPLGAALSLSVTTIGAGIIALPSTFDDCGILVVILLMLLVGTLTVHSIDYLILCVETLQLRSYEEISREVLGRFFEEVARWILIVYNIGAAAGYIVVIKEIFSPLLPTIRIYFPFLHSSTHVILILWGCMMLPLSCIPKISSLRFISVTAVIATFFISSIITYRYFAPLQNIEKEEKYMYIHDSNNSYVSSALSSLPDIKYVSFSLRTILALPILLFSFDCQTLVFQIYSSINNQTRQGMKTVSVLSICVTSLFYLLVGLFGYLSYTSHVHGNILTNYNPLKDNLFAMGEILYSFTIVTAYVLVLFPCRDAVFILLYGYNNITYNQQQHYMLDSRDSRVISMKDNLLVSSVLSVITLVLAVQAPGIVYIIALLGGFCGSTLCFIYPAVFRLRLHTLGLAPATLRELFVTFSMLGVGCIGVLMGFVVMLTGMN